MTFYITGGGGAGIDPATVDGAEFDTSYLYEGLYGAVRHLFEPDGSKNEATLINRQVMKIESSYYKEMKDNLTKKINKSLKELEGFNQATVELEISNLKNLFDEITDFGFYTADKDEPKSLMARVASIAFGDIESNFIQAEKNLMEIYFKRVDFYINYLTSLEPKSLEKKTGNLAEFLEANLPLIKENKRLHEKISNFFSKDKQSDLVFNLRSDTCLTQLITPAIEEAFKFLINVGNVDKSFEISRSLFERFNFILQKIVSSAATNLSAFRNFSFFQEERREIQKLYESINRVEFILTPKELKDFISLTINIEDIFRLGGLTKGSIIERANRVNEFAASLYSLNARLYPLIGTETIALKADQLEAQEFSKVVRAYQELMPQTLVFQAIQFPTLVKWFGRMILENKTTDISLELLSQSFPALSTYLNMMKVELTRFNAQFELELANDCDVLDYFNRLLGGEKGEQRDALKDKLEAVNPQEESLFPLLSQFLNRSHLISVDERLKEEEFSIS